jgi:hypothetical protein
MIARTTEGVYSGRRVKDRPPLSLNVYISLITISDVSPVPFSNSSVASKTGVLICLYPYSSNIALQIFSTRCQVRVSGGRMSRVPLIEASLRCFALTLLQTLLSSDTFYNGDQFFLPVTTSPSLPAILLFPCPLRRKQLPNQHGLLRGVPE